MKRRQHAEAYSWARRRVPHVVAQRMLGHQDVRLTGGVYVHVGVEKLRQAVESHCAPTGARVAQ